MIVFISERNDQYAKISGGCRTSAELPWAFRARLFPNGISTFQNVHTGIILIVPLFWESKLDVLIQLPISINNSRLYKAYSQFYRCSISG